MQDHISRVANAISVGASAEDVHDVLKGEGMSEYDIFLTYTAGKMLHQARANMKAIPKPKVRRIQ